MQIFGQQGRWTIAIDPSYISKAGKNTPHIGRFWSGCAQSVKHGLEILGIGLIDIDTKDCMMLRAHQSLNNKELSLRNKTMVDFYISVIKRYRKELLKLSTLMVADVYFSTSTNLDLTRMEKMEMKDIEGTAYTLIAYSKALKCKVRLVIWQMPNGKKKLFFSTDTSLSGKKYFFIIEPGSRSNFAFVMPKAILVLWTGRLAIGGNSILLSMLLHFTKCCQGNYEGDGNGIFYVFIQVTDDQHLSGETNF